ncbi:transglycosylase SLT domain-containing protein [Streptomyces albus]|uniref:aggregation-promoting factor C-terminal-like domain-containing protein n=1 Tax=Streptomyces albus TaxID=1888 RepID=UPI0036F96EDD
MLLLAFHLPRAADAHPVPDRDRSFIQPGPSLYELVVAHQHQQRAALDQQAASQRTLAAQRLAEQRSLAEAARQKKRAQTFEAAREHQAQDRAVAQRRQRTQVRPEHVSRSIRPAPATIGSARSFARSRLPAAQYACLTNLISKESGWNHTATNPSSGAYGLFQALPGSKMISAGTDWRTNPLTQMKWGLSYIKSRYGNACNAWGFWMKNKWY